MNPWMLYNMLYRYKSQTLTFIRTYNSYKTISTIATTTDSLALSTSFLKHKCTSSSIRLESSSDENAPNSVLKLFQAFGFSQTHITGIIAKEPYILTFHPQKYLKPKLDFLLSITHSQSDVVNIVAKNPNLFKRSLKNHLIPVYNTLKSVTGSDQNAAAVIKCNPFVLSFCISKSFLQNIEFLQKLGVPQSQILKLITKYGQSIGVKHEKFCKVVLKVKDMGFDLSSSCFIEAVRSLTFLTELAWESRCQMYRNFGFSNDDIFTMFKKQPISMGYSEKRIREMLEFFVHKLRWSPSRLSTTPNVFTYSLEKRIIPRCSVLQALVSNKCNNKSLMLPTILRMTESRFLKSFVTAVKDEVPEVMDAYQGKLTFDEYRFESERKAKFKTITSTISTTVTSDSLALATPFLKHKCGSSGKPLSRAINLVPLESSDGNGPDAVLKLLKAYGFSETHITRIINRQRHLLKFQFQKYIKPKLDFLLSITHSQSEVVDIVAKNPVMLTRSLNNHIIPFFTSLQSVTGSDQSAVAAVKRNPFLLSNCVSTNFLQNIEFLQKVGVPQYQILKLITEYGQSVGENHGKFCKVVLKVKDMGIDLSSSYFLDAVRSFSFLSDLAWESRCEMYRNFGFSDEDIISMAKKQPIIMSYSEKRMWELLEFFVHKLRWSSTRLSTTPSVFRYSLEKRIIPRCSVLQALVSNKCNIKGLMLTSIVAMTESRFLESFVTAYKDEVPEVMDAYQGKLRFHEYNFE